MEVLGAVASSIAVVQALAAGKHAVSLFREIPDIQKYFDYLMKELEMIKSMAQAVSRMAPTALEQDLITTAARNLSEITAELEALLRICSRESGPDGNKRSKTRKRKWLVEKSDIKKLQQRMGQSKETLHFALNSSRVSSDVRFQTEMRQMMINMYTMHISAPHPPLESPPPVQQLQDAHTSESDAVHLIRHAGADVTSLRANTEALVGCIHSLDPGLYIYSLFWQLYPSLEVLLDTWKNILTEVGLPRRVAITAASVLRYSELNDKQTYLVQKVLGLGRDISEVTTTKVHEAIVQCANLQEALQEQPWAINTIDDTGESPLYLATDLNRVRSMEVLISAGADVNQQSYDGQTPLMVAVWAENIESIKMLLKSKSNVNLCDEEGVTALHWASETVNPEVISLLLAAGASVKQRDIFGDTPLHCLAESENTSHQDIEAAIEMLLVAGSDLEARNQLGNTPFLGSIRCNKVEVTRGLVDAGCSVNISNSQSQNVLHVAANHASQRLLQYLSVLDLSGINPCQEDSFGDTPFDELVRTSYATDEWDLISARRPGLTEQDAFVELYQGVQDQALQIDIQNLGRVLVALQQQDIKIAREHLALLVEKEKRWERENLVSWYRAVDKRVQHAEWDLAAEDIEGHLLDLQEELATPVWEIPSNYGYLWESADGVSVSEDGFKVRTDLKTRMILTNRS
ncbi:ankyrin repeat PH SEC7 domain-containing protein [Fusarium circinatum]|uniref:Ankyrin repeat PH SEC7 domain-containing protein n=1 Tax=Fusarium circinatum TaxID=48490 RepID=A0A8H5U1R3_FUSCI|nr:ankyrin repeat PH SEC7 domain-containing protein [Fusarium circinatum]